MNIVFTPSAAGARSALLTVVDSAASSPQSAVLTGIGTSSPKILTASTPSLLLGGQLVGGTPLFQYISLQNTGSASVNIQSVSITGANASDFAVSDNWCQDLNPLPPGAACQISITFNAGAVGPRNANLTVVSDHRIQLLLCQ